MRGSNINKNWSRSLVARALAVATLLAAALLVQPVQAQVLYGSLVGSVTDPSGALVGDAVVSIANPLTGQTREVSTDSMGRFSMPNILPGNYDLKVTKTGFRAYTRTGVSITLNTVTRADIGLEVGAVTETVTVAAAATPLQTDKADVHVEINVAAMKNLTLPNYRNYQSLINLVPGATPAIFQNAITDTPARALSSNINGTNRNNNNTKIDGATNVYIWLPHHTAYVPPVETIDTVNITTNAMDAEQGMAGGAAITVNTKSGTNQFHGTGFAFYDSHNLRARNFFLRTPTKPRTVNNIDGGTLGGPIVQNKLFFFGGWEGTRERGSRNRQLSVGTGALRSGDFSRTGTTIYDPDTGDDQGRGRRAFDNNSIPLSRQSSIMRKLQDLVPAANAPGEFANYFVVGSQAMNRDNFDVKMNWNRNDRSVIWGKWGLMDAQVTGPFSFGAAGGPCLCDGGSGVGDTVVNVATIGSSYTVSSNFLIDGTIGFTRMGQVVTGPDFGNNFGLDVLGIPGTNGPDPRQSGLPIFNIGGYTGLGNTEGWSPIFRNDQSWTLTTNANWVKGSHDLRFGFEGIHHHLNHWQPELGAGPRGTFGFGGAVSALNGGPSPDRFNGYAQFLLGLTSSVGKSIQFNKMTGLEYQLGWYVRDRWAVTPKLTLTLGLRYELYPLMTRASGGIERYDQATNQVFLGGYGNQPKNAGVTTSKKLFAPRLGIAYRLNDATVIRTGYGITYNPMPLARPLRGFYPLTIGSDFTALNTFAPFNRIEQGIPNICCPDLSSGVVQLPAPALMRTPFLGQLKRGYIQSWNFFVERKLPAEFVMSVGYVGTQTVRSFADLDINAATAPGTGNAGRPAFSTFRRITSTLLWQGWVNANYHSLQVAVNRHFTRSLMIKGAYTYSRAINWTDDDGWAGMPITNHQPSLRRNRAQAGYNIPQIFNVGYVYELPLGKGKRWANSNPAARAVLGGWQLNGIFSAFQGRPFTVGASGASLNMPGTGQTADQAKSDVTKIGQIGPGTKFYDPDAFLPVTAVRFGTTGRNILRNPGVVNLSQSIFKAFPIREGWELTFRAEAFNAGNTPHFGGAASNASDRVSFMQITGAASDERQFRLGLRLQF